MIFQTILGGMPCQENRLFVQRAVAGETTKPIYYESRFAKLALNAASLPKLDAEFEEITEGEEPTKKDSRAAWDAARQTERSAARRL